MNNATASSPTTISIEWDLGLDQHRRPVRVKRERDGSWTLIREAGDQRDTEERVTGLTADNLRGLAMVANSAR